MRAEAGAELAVRGRHVGDADRAGVIIEIHGNSDGHESVFSPSFDTHVEHRPARRRRGS
jgi:hypothetical protein